MIRTRRLYEFISELVEIRKEELDEKAQWEFWLHKDFERSFKDFKEEIESSATQEISREELVSLVNQTREITNSFIPPAEDL